MALIQIWLTCVFLLVQGNQRFPPMLKLKYAETQTPRFDRGTHPAIELLE